MTSQLRAVLRLSILAVVTLLLVPVQVVLVALRRDWAERFPRLYHRFCAWLLGFEVRVFGTASTARPTLFVSNHISYIDIMVLGSVLDAAFVAKAEVAKWPVFGTLAKLQRCVFVDRSRRKAAAQRDEIGRRLAAGDRLVLFPEGTSGDGRAVLPFKAALFAVAKREPDGPPLAVQPVSICYTRLDGLPLGRALRPYLAWYGGMTFFPHLVELMGLGRVTVEVRFHPLLDTAAYTSRKALAEACRKVIMAGLDASKHGIPDMAATPEAETPAAAPAEATS